MSQASNHSAQHVYTTGLYQSPRRRTPPVLLGGMKGLANPKQRSPDRDLRIDDGQLDRLLETTKIVVWEAEAEDGRFTYVSEQAQKILGYPSADWYEPNFLGLHLHPEDKHRIFQFRLLLWKTGDAVRLSVSDNGCGFDQKSEMKQSGLGFISMRERVHLLGGEMRINSQPECGTPLMSQCPW